MRVSNESIKQLAHMHGFALCGVCEAKPSDHGDFFRGWLAAGKHGEMAWLARNVETRLDPRKLLEDAKSIVMVVDRLPAPLPSGEGAESRRDQVGEGAPTHDQSRDAAHPLPTLPQRGRTFTAGRIARYAQISDYHRVMKKRLAAMCDALRAVWPNDSFRGCVDTAPLMEREHAHRAGLGWTGKHTLLLNDQLGSHLMLGGIVTTLQIAPDEPGADHCGTCTRCIDACPTDAITPYSVDATRCISYLTIEHRGAIDSKFHRAIGDWLFGCDMCQEVCPYVKRAQAPAEPPPGYQRHRSELDAAQVMNWSEHDRREAFEASAMKRAKLEMIRRNALIVAGNRLRRRDDADLRSRIRQIADNAGESDMIRLAAQEALGD